jgi:hypothetical protein
LQRVGAYEAHNQPALNPEGPCEWVGYP